ncbi:MAG: mechanosensitive ion channel family protein [Butyrivibrio sp.]|nr:mechanosensitive ion channel family protein [Butyrivibrio sp.]MBP3813922.1 mechanosensitive ion channel family protein [Butyrivibrio sp.]
MNESFMDKMPQVIANISTDLSTGQALALTGITVLLILLGIALWLFVAIGILKINKKIFARLEEKKGNSITLQFLQKAIALGIIVVFFVLPMGGEQIARSLLGSTAVVAAVVGLAANDVIKNMFAGLEISIYKPFDVGSRIMLDDGTVGIVEKLTLRHVVLRLIDTTRVIIPNSKANSATIINYSYAENVPRSFDVRFPISYDSDLDKAKEVIRKTICECPLTLNRDKYTITDPNSKSVYFLEIQESALLLGATVYYPHELRTEVVKDEVNSAVFKALKENKIEIPYNYVNVVMNEK